jgi:hypothetical protein
MVNNHMKYTNSITAVLVAIALLGFAAPAAAQPADNANIPSETQVSDNTDSTGVLGVLADIQQELEDIRERLSDLENQMNETDEGEGENEAEGPQEFEGQVDSSNDSAGSFTLAKGTTVHVTEDTTFEADGDLSSIEELENTQEYVKAEGEATMTDGKLVAVSVKLETGEEAEKKAPENEREIQEKENEYGADDSKALGVSMSEARDTATDALSNNGWRLEEADTHEVDGYYKFEFISGESEAEVRVDGSTGDISRFEEEIEEVDVEMEREPDAGNEKEAENEGAENEKVELEEDPENEQEVEEEYEEETEEE